MQAQLDELLEKIELLPLNTLDANKVGIRKSHPFVKLLKI